MLLNFSVSSFLSVKFHHGHHIHVHSLLCNFANMYKICVYMCASLQICATRWLFGTEILQNSVLAVTAGHYDAPLDPIVGWGGGYPSLFSTSSMPLASRSCVEARHLRHSDTVSIEFFCTHLCN